MQTKNVITALAALAQESRLAVFRLLVTTVTGAMCVHPIWKPECTPCSVSA